MSRLPRRPPDETNGHESPPRTLKVYFIDKKPLETKIFKYDFYEQNGIRAEDLVTKICKEKEILPKHTALFGICTDEDGNGYIPYSKKITPESYKKEKLHFRLQFKAVDCTALRREDKKAFEYYLLQCRHDFVHGFFRKNLSKQENHNKKQEMLLRMVILEMLLQSEDEATTLPKHRTTLLQQIFRRRHSYSIESILSKYVGEKEEVRKCKKIIEKSLQMFENVKEPEFDFLREIEFLPNYQKETLDGMYKVYGRNDITSHDDIWISVHPKDGVSRLRLIDEKFKKADEKFQFEDVKNLTIRQTEDNPTAPKYQLIIGVHGKAPEVLFSDSEAVLECLCSWIDGYYRLLVDQYVSLLQSPAVSNNAVIHGPIEHSISEKLLESCQCTEGDYLIRQHRRSYGEFVLTTLSANGFKHYEIYRQSDDQGQKYYIEKRNLFSSVEDLVKYYHENNDANCLNLKRRIKPVGPMPFLSERKSSSLVKRLETSPHRSEVSWIVSKSLIKLKDMPKGMFGEVSLCEQRLDSHTQKVIVRKFKGEEISKNAFEKIAVYCKDMQNPLIVRLTGLSLPEDSIKLLAFEYMECGPLDEYLAKNREAIRYRTVLKYIIDVAEGMMYLEKTMRVVHGNLRLRNVLLMDSDNLKISDACFDWIMQQEGRLPMTSILSSCNWRAPEVINGENLTHLSDVWSFGMVIWEIFSLSKPIGNISKEKLLESLSSDVTLTSTLPYCSDEIKEVLSYCWKEDPKQRMHFEEIFYSLKQYKRSVPNDFLERNYYNWWEIERDERENLRLQRIKMAQHLSRHDASLSHSGLSDNLASSNSGGTSGSKPYHFIAEDRSDSSNESASSKSTFGFRRSTDRLVSLDQQIIDHSRIVSDLRQGSSISIPCSDIEMKDLSVTEIHSRPADDKTTLITRPVAQAPGAHEELMETDFKQTSKPLSNLTELVKDINSKESIVSSRLAEGTTTKISSINRSISEEQSEAEDYVTADVMEVANVLASMAHQRGSDQKRRNPSELEFEGRKIPKIIKKDREMPQLHKAILLQKTLIPMKVGHYSPNVSMADQPYDSAYESGSSASFGSSNTLRRHPGPSRPSLRQQTPVVGLESSGNKPVKDMQLSFDRKKRSHSVSEETNKMHKKAAKRALDKPNPFNLGSTVPKNFLMKRKEPPLTQLKTQQPIDASKYFHEIPISSSSTKNASNLPTQHDRITQKAQEDADSKQSEDQPYKSWSEIQQLGEKMSYLKANSPQNTSQPSSTNTVLQATADPNAVQAAINAYLTQLVSQGHSVVAGSPVFIPQLALNTTINQAAALPQILHLLQTQQKLGQPVRTSPQIIPPNHQADTSFQISPAYLQTLLAIMASKNFMASSANNNQQHTQTVAVSTLSVSPSVVSVPSSLTSTPSYPPSVASSVSSPSNQASQEPYKKVVDIKPKIAPNTIDLTRSDQVPVLPSSSVSNNHHDKPQLLKIPQGNPSIPQNSLLSLFDGKNQSPRPIFVKTTQTMQPTFIDSTKQPPRQVLLTPAPKPHPVRLQPLILPKSLPDHTEQHKDRKMSPSQAKQTSNLTRAYSDQPFIENRGIERPTNRIKVEPPSPSPAYTRTATDLSHSLYRTLSPSSSPLSASQLKQRRISVDEVRGFSEKLSQVQKRRQSEESSNILAQLGNVNVFNNNDLSFEKKLGEGQFGEVWKALLRCKGKSGNITLYPVAVKKLKNTEEQSYEQFKNEVKQLASLDNDYIVKLIGVSVDPKGEAEGPWIITDLMALGNLNQFIVNNRQTLTEDTLLRFAVQIACGMEFLQSRSVVHRDLAARNVLVESRDRVKVSDFGLSRMFGDNKDYYRAKTPSRLPIRWYALESIRDSVFTSKSDVWSYGVTLWEVFVLLSSKRDYANPYEEMDGTEMFEFLEKGNRLAKPEKCKDELWTIILGCWNEKPDDRPSFYLLSYEILKIIQN